MASEISIVQNETQPHKRRTLIATLIAVIVTGGAAFAAEPAGEPTRAFFGDLHLHTAYSFDAFIFKTVATPNDAYKFAKGVPLRHPTGAVYQLEKPLDFLAVTDHSEFMGVLRSMAEPNSPLARLPIVGKVTDPDVDVSMGAFNDIVTANLAGRSQSVLGDPQDWQGVVSESWARMIEAANRNYEPGKFTTFIAYEYTSTPDGRNLHRNVIYRGKWAPQPLSLIHI